MGSVVSFINMKGGVGKTTSSVTLAETCASEFGWRVLLIDLDAQASASYALCGEEKYETVVEAEKTIACFFDPVADGVRPAPLASFITEGDTEDLGAGVGAPGAKIDVVCAEPGLRFTERSLIERFYKLRQKRVVTASAPEGQTRRVMRDALASLRKVYDLIVIDCPPGISVFAEAGVACSDLIVVPTIPDYLSTLGLKELNRKFIRQLRRDGNLRGRIAILPTKVQDSNATHRRYLKILDDMVRNGEINAAFLDTFIAESAHIARALDSALHGEQFKQKYGKVREDLLAFAEEIKGLLEHDGVAGEASEAEDGLKRGRRAGGSDGRVNAA